jgi:hypothetical protein
MSVRFPHEWAHLSVRCGVVPEQFLDALIAYKFHRIEARYELTERLSTSVPFLICAGARR